MAASSSVRFWGTVVAVRPRLTLAKFEGETTARCEGHLYVVEGTRTVGSERPVPGGYVVAVGPATQERRAVRPGDLLRGDARPVPEGHPDTPADLYRVGTFHVLARAGDPGASASREPDPPRTDPPLTPPRAEAAPRRPLDPANLSDEGPCRPCPYGTIVAVVRLSDPRDWRRGEWRQVPACLGPADCPYYARPATGNLSAASGSD
jgi:hypothetical protein